MPPTSHEIQERRGEHASALNRIISEPEVTSLLVSAAECVPTIAGDVASQPPNVAFAA
jgi:hypothetical protein